MCGICGIAYADRFRAVEPSTLEAMCGCTSHRGPDDQGIYLAGSIGLGHRRLSIIDVAGGHQPMGNEDESVWIAYNGEVYNHAGFRSGLEIRGHRYRSRCDTEAIIHLYEEHGADVAAALHGMFAFAIWDSRRNSLVLARDRVGVKPLFYALTPQGDLVFASEIKAIFASGLVRPSIDQAAVPEYFAMGHIAGGRTLYESIRTLPPGHVLEWRAGSVSIRPYFTLAEQPYPALRDDRDIDERAAEFWTLFREAVCRMLMADVPLGVFLSGGLDSSLIVAAMRDCGVGALQSFSVGFDEPEANELPFARVVANAFGTKHHEVTVGADEFFEALPELTWHRDSPLTFSASIPLYFVSRLARDHVTVVLTGEGSDELFAGYGRYVRGYHNMRFARMLDRVLPNSIRTGVAALARKSGNGYLGNRLKRSFLVRRGTFQEAYLEAFAEFDQEQRNQLLVGATRSNPYRELGALVDDDLLRANPVEAMLRLDQRTYLEELLAKQDQMSMAASIESRVPFLDESLVEWAARLPTDAKLRGTVGKAVVRAAATQRLPHAVVHGKKRGFTLPLARWFRGRGRVVLEDAAPSRHDELLRGDYVRKLIDEHARGWDHAGRLWRILAFQIWRRDVIPRLRQVQDIPAQALL